MKSVMSHQFGRVPHADIPRSSFDRSHGVKMTFDSGLLYPFFVDEALPGDTFNLRSAGFARMSTPIYPVMDNIWLETFYFAVPLRLIWTNFVKMMGEQDNPTDSTDYTTPTLPGVATTGYAEGSLYDYLGIPTQVPDLETSALFTRAYNLIWNEWFRDQNLQDSVVVDTDDGPDNPSDYELLRRGKRHDYFTSCLPWPQKNNTGTDVLIPLGSTAPLKMDATAGSYAGGTDHHLGILDSSDTLRTMEHTGTSGNAVFMGTLGSSDTSQAYADLASASAATINQLRTAFQVQKLYERDARGGTRYTEIIRSHFSVVSPDARLQRPEYLGGGSTPINITPIAQTSESNTTAQGTLAAMGTASFNGHGFVKSFTEHCVLIGLVNVRADITYQRGLNRMFSRQDRFDYYWPALAQIGEQAVLNKEIYAQGTSVDDEVFGYQERFAEYRFRPSQISGAFRSNAATPLDAWHLSQDFASLPTLGSTFIEDNPPISRVVAVPSEPEFIADFHHNLKCARPMPLYGVPGLLDHF
jgi:hypothetical protein